MFDKTSKVFMLRLSPCRGQLGHTETANIFSYHIPTFAKAPLTQCSTAPYNTTHRVLFLKKKLKKNNKKY